MPNTIRITGITHSAFERLARDLCNLMEYDDSALFQTRNANHYGYTLTTTPDIVVMTKTHLTLQHGNATIALRNNEYESVETI